MQDLVVEAYDDFDEGLAPDAPEAQIIDDEDSIKFALDVLQEGIKAKCQAHGSGGARGLTLAKITFALRIKYSKQYDMLMEFVDSLPETDSQSPAAVAADFSDDDQYRTLS